MGFPSFRVSFMAEKGKGKVTHCFALFHQRGMVGRQEDSSLRAGSISALPQLAPSTRKLEPLLDNEEQAQ